MTNLKQSWRDFKKSKPGERFRAHYRKRQQKRRSPVRKVLFIGTGVLVLAAGVFFLPAPGPGTLVLMLGAGLIAEESYAMARILDWLEVRIRKVVDWALRIWRRLPIVAQVAIVVIAAAAAAGVAYLAYTILWRK